MAKDMVEILAMPFWFDETIGDKFFLGIFDFPDFQKRCILQATMNNVDMPLPR